MFICYIVHQWHSSILFWLFLYQYRPELSRVAVFDAFFQLLKSRYVFPDDRFRQCPRRLPVIEMGHVVALGEHGKPDLFLHAGVIPVSLLDHGTQRPCRRCRNAFIDEQFLQHLPAQFELDENLSITPLTTNSLKRSWSFAVSSTRRFLQ